MKKIKFFMCNLIAIAMLCTFMTSCNEDGVAEIYNVSVPNTPISSPRSEPSISRDSSFWNSVDSINFAHNFQKQGDIKIVGQIGSRVGDGMPTIKNEYNEIKSQNLIGGKIADQLGSIAGRYGARWLGDKACKDPQQKKYWRRLGQFVGEMSGCILASALANVFIPFYEKNGSITPGSHPSDNLESKWGTKLTPGITPSSPQTVEDSIGYIHNKIMNKLTSNRNKYIKNGNINYNLMYTDCIAFLKEEGIYNDTITYDLQYRNNVIDFATKVADNSLACYDGHISGKEVLDKGIVLLKQKYNITDEEAQDLEKLSYSVTQTAWGMNQVQAQNYLDDMNAVITNSNLAPQRKERMTTLVNLTINSGMFWDSLK